VWTQGNAAGQVGTGLCITTDTTRTEARIQVLARRRSKVEALFWDWNLTLESKAVARFEAAP
jgi:hypothetical protein